MRSKRLPPLRRRAYRALWNALIELAVLAGIIWWLVR